MNLNETEMHELQELTLPAGYYLVDSGSIKPGDIRWNVWHDCWNLEVPVSSPLHDCIIGDSVKNCHGICRKIQTINQ